VVVLGRNTRWSLHEVEWGDVYWWDIKKVISRKGSRDGSQKTNLHEVVW